MLLGVAGGGLTGLMAAGSPSGWRVLLQVDAVVSWVAALLLFARSSTSTSWRRVAAGWAPALPAAYAVGLLVQALRSR